MIKRIFTAAAFSLVLFLGSAAGQTWDCGNATNTGGIESVKATLSGGTLTISGTGAMADYTGTGGGSAPWYNSRNSIASIVIEEGVTSIGRYAFSSYTGLTSVAISNSVVSIGVFAFAGCTRLASVTIGNSVTHIEREAFARTGLTSVIIPNSVDSIEISAFQGTGLTSVIIPGNVTYIGEGAFSYCSDLVSIEVASDNNDYSSEDGVLFNKDKTALIQYPGGKRGAYTIPNSVTSINESAFYYCRYLTSVTIPSSVISIGAMAFSGCSGLTSITIPNSVAFIGSGAFSGCSGLTSIVIPDGVFSILDGTFSGCTSLTSITIPNSVVSIGATAFSFCNNLTSVTIPNSVTTIGGGAFNGTGLTSIIIPSSVTSIANSAFSDCRTLTSIEVESDNENYSSENGVLFNKDKTTLILYPRGREGAYTIPNGVTSVASEAFWHSPGLTSLNIPGSLISMGDYTFSNSMNLNSIEAALDNANYSSENGVLFNKDKTVLIRYPQGRQGAAVIPSGVTSIGEYAFWGCRGLTSIVSLNDIPPAIGSLSSFTGVCLYVPQGSINAYREADGWKNFNCIESINPTWDCGITPGTVSATLNVEQGTLTISGTGAMANYNYDRNAPWHNSRNSIASIVIEEGVTSIGRYAFWSYTSLTSVAISNSVVSIGAFAFAYCKNLTSTTIGNSVTSIGNDAFHNSGLTSITIPNGVTSIGSGAFSNCHSLASVAIPNSVTSIGSGAFSFCRSLTSVTIPNGIASIEDNVFHGSGLTSVTIPNSVVSIGLRAFLSCADLISVTIPNSVTSIGAMAFSGSGLTSVTIHDRVTSIGDGAFSNCTSLASIEVASDNANYSSENGVLFNKGKTVLLQYPGGKQGAYTIPNSVVSIENSAFSNSIGLSSVVIGNGVTSIGDDMFSGSSLTSVTIPNSVVSIGLRAFLSCTGLTSITIPGSVTSIGYWAFYGSGLTSVTIHDRVTSIGDGAFSHCTSLTSIEVASDNANYSSADGVLFNKDKTTLIQYPLGKQGAYIIPSSVTSIEGWAFYTSVGLTSVTIPNSVTSIGVGAFRDCINLTSVTNLNAIPHVLGFHGFVFEGVDMTTACLYVPQNSINAYRAAGGWATFNCINPVSATNYPTITFNSQGGSAVIAQTLIIGTQAAKPTNPTRTGQIFNGWYKDAAFTEEWNFDTDVVSENMALYAKWTPSAVSILSSNRVIPSSSTPDTQNPNIKSSNVTSGNFTAGPNPVVKHSGSIGFFWEGRSIQNGTLFVYSASGNLVKKINITDKSTGKSEKRSIGQWDLKDSKGRLVSEGSYVVKGTITGKDGKREKVSIVLGVR